MPINKLCNSQLCPQRQSCYRYLGLPKEKQEYISFYNQKKAKCDCFVALIPNEKIVWDLVE